MENERRLARGPKGTGATILGDDTGNGEVGGEDDGSTRSSSECGGGDEERVGLEKNEGEKNEPSILTCTCGLGVRGGGSFGAGASGRGSVGEASWE